MKRSSVAVACSLKQRQSKPFNVDRAQRLAVKVGLGEVCAVAEILMFRPVRPVRTLADVEAIEQTPLSALIQARSTYELFQASARENGEGVALTFLPDARGELPVERYTYAALLARINQIANTLHGLGVGPRDAIGILLPGCAEYHFALWGGEAAGIVQPLNPLLTVEKLSSLIKATGAKVLIAWADDDDAGIWRKLARLDADIRHILYVSHEGRTPDTSDIAAQVSSLNKLADQQPGDRLLSGRQIQPQDVAAYFHTGGTTGSPKLAVHTHAGQVYTAWASVQMQGLSPTDCAINGYPLFHVAGVLPGALACFSAGAEVVIPTAGLFRNKDVINHFWRLVETWRPTVMSAVPTVLAALLEVDPAGADTSSIRYFRTGASPLSPELAQRFKQHTGFRVHESLGMTEMTGISTITPPGLEAQAGSVGLRLPHSQLRIMKLDANGQPSAQEAAPHESGMVQFRSPNIFQGYLGNIDRQTYLTDDGWLITGDIGALSTEGLLKLQGRAKDLIIRSGHNIDPQVIEQALDSHPAVNSSAAVGAPDPYAGEVPVAFVTLKKGAWASAEELRAHAASHVDEPPARPRYVEILPSLPMTNVGKIFKPGLRDIAKSRYLENIVQALMRQKGVAESEWPNIKFEASLGFTLHDPHFTVSDQELAGLQREVRFIGADVRVVQQA